MKLIIPMAGMGKRMRPHTLTTPKPLLKIAGKPLVQRIVLELINSSKRNFDEIHFVIGDFGGEIEKILIKIAEESGAKAYIHYQKEPLGTAHAVYCSREALKGEVMIAFADTLFKGNFNIQRNDEGIIWTMRVKNPEQYGVVITDKQRIITEFAEKPSTFLSDEAIIGIYFFKEGRLLKDKIDYLFQHKILVKGEYQLTDALELLLRSGLKIKSENIVEWLDCGNKDEFINSAMKVIDQKRSNDKEGLKDVRFFKPVYCGKDIKITDSDIGPGVILEDGCVVTGSVIKNSIIYEGSKIKDSNIEDSMIGRYSVIERGRGIFNVGDFSVYEKK